MLLIKISRQEATSAAQLTPPLPHLTTSTSSSPPPLHRCASCHAWQWITWLINYIFSSLLGWNLGLEPSLTEIGPIFLPRCSVWTRLVAAFYIYSFLLHCIMNIFVVHCLKWVLFRTPGWTNVGVCLENTAELFMHESLHLLDSLNRKHLCHVTCLSVYCMMSLDQ